MNKETLLLATTVCLYAKSKRPKRKWVKTWLSNRPILSHLKSIEELSQEPQDWRNFLRMDEEIYHHLLRLVTPLIKKKDTNMRQCISPHERLAATLRFLATGMNYEELKFSTIISPQRLGVIIPETCLAIIKALKNYMKTPGSQGEWKAVGREFQRKWNFPNCIGAIDGKHVRITPPPNSGSHFFNYKKFHSLVLMACANANYEFLWCEVDTNGRISDGDAIRNTKFFERLTTGSVPTPPPAPVQGSSMELPYVYIGNEAFALRTDFMIPFSQETLNQEQRIYNYRLSRARQVVENAFGILANRFRIFQRNINLSLERIEVVVLCCCVLHNFLIKNSKQYFNDEDTEQTTFEYLLTPLDQIPHNCSNQAKRTREIFVDFFNGEGAVQWQTNCI